MLSFLRRGLLKEATRSRRSPERYLGLFHVLENSGWSRSQPRREASDYYFLRTFVLHVAHCCFIFFFSSKKSKEIVENKKKNIYVYVYMIFRYIYIVI